MYFIVYKTTNLITGMYYIGCHKTKNLEDGYIGSGTSLKKDIKKYGLINFEREIIYFCSSQEEMFQKESLLVNEKLVHDTSCYNLKTGGHGGFDWINKNISYEDKKIHEARKIHLEKWKNDFSYKLKCLEKLNKIIKTKKYKQTHKNGLLNYYKNNCGSFTGKTHSEETKEKMKNSARGKHNGEKNSQYNTCWMYSFLEKKNIKIRKNEIKKYLKLGWLRGRKMKF